jgi:hypothetical protein
MTPVEQEIAEALARMADFPLESMGPGTRLWHDLGLAGDDFYDFIESFHQRFGASLDGKPDDYSPSEGELMRYFWWWPFARTKAYREVSIAGLARLATG